MILYQLIRCHISISYIDTSKQFKCKNICFTHVIEELDNLSDDNGDFADADEYADQLGDGEDGVFDSGAPDMDNNVDDDDDDDDLELGDDDDDDDDDFDDMKFDEEDVEFSDNGKLGCHVLHCIYELVAFSLK